MQSLNNNANFRMPIALLGRVFTPHQKKQFGEFDLIHKELL